MSEILMPYLLKAELYLKIAKNNLTTDLPAGQLPLLIIASFGLYADCYTKKEL